MVRGCVCGGGRGGESSLLNFTFPPQADVLYFGEVIVPDAIHDQVWMLANILFTFSFGSDLSWLKSWQALLRTGRN